MHCHGQDRLKFMDDVITAGLKRGARGPAAPAVSPSKWVPGQMNPGSSPPMCRTPLPRPGPHPYRRPSTPGCEAGERLPPSPSDPTLSVDLRKTALLRSLLLRTEVLHLPGSL